MIKGTLNCRTNLVPVGPLIFALSVFTGVCYQSDPFQKFIILTIRYNINGTSRRVAYLTSLLTSMMKPTSGKLLPY